MTTSRFRPPPRAWGPCNPGTFQQSTSKPVWCAREIAKADEKSVGGDYETVGLQLHQPGEDSIEIAFGTGVENQELEPQRASRCLKFARLGLGDGMHSIDERADGSRRRDQSVQQFQSLRLQLNAQRGHAGEIDARSAQASDEPESDRINAGDEDDRNDRGGSFGRKHPKDVTGLGDYGAPRLPWACEDEGKRGHSKTQ
jgi:hypothetical protein